MTQIEIDYPEREATIEVRFRLFHDANPWVYTRLVALAREQIALGATKIGIGMLWEVLRWQRTFETSDPTSDLKLNDHYRSRYARLMMARERDLAGIFETRSLRAA